MQSPKKENQKNSRRNSTPQALKPIVIKELSLSEYYQRKMLLEQKKFRSQIEQLCAVVKQKNCELAVTNRIVDAQKESIALLKQSNDQLLVLLSASGRWKPEARQAADKLRIPFCIN